MNKIYYEPNCNIIVAKSTAEARSIAKSVIEWLDEEDIQVEQVTPRSSFQLESLAPGARDDLEFEIKGKNKLRTNLLEGSISWEQFIAELKAQNRYKVILN